MFQPIDPLKNPVSLCERSLQRGDLPRQDAALLVDTGLEGAVASSQFKQAGIHSAFLT